MRIFKVKTFTRFQRRERIPDASLVKAVRDADQGLIDADLGDGLIKQRVARRGQGKRRGYRTVIAYRREHRAVFLLGFAKSDKASVEDDELVELKSKGQVYLALSKGQIESLLIDEDLTEIDHDEDGDEERQE